jgi:hypothetical protein
LALLRLVEFGNSGLLIRGAFLLLELEVFYFVALIVCGITVFVVFALPGSIADISPRNDIIDGY